MAEIKVITRDEFKVVLQQFKKKESSASASAVLEKFEQQLGFGEGDRYAVAFEKDDPVGAMVMTKRGTNWWIDDLVSFQRGVGTLLSNDGIAFATGDTPEEDISLISLDAGSTGFWKKFGFTVNGAQVGDKNVGMTRKA